MIKAVKDVENMLSKVDVTEGAVDDFQKFAETELFINVPKEISYKLYSFSTTISFLNMKYFFKLGDYELSFVLKGTKNVKNDAVYKDYFNCSFAFLKNDKIIGDVRVFEGCKEEFVQIFDSLIQKFINKIACAS